MKKQGFDLKSMWDSAKPYVGPTLAGAGIGAAGMGLANHFGSNETDPAKRNTSLRNSMLMGAGLGGAGGIAGHLLGGISSDDNGLTNGSAGVGAKVYSGARNILTGHPAISGLASGMLPGMKEMSSNAGGWKGLMGKSTPGGAGVSGILDSLRGDKADLRFSPEAGGNKMTRAISGMFGASKGMFGSENLTSKGIHGVVENLHAGPESIQAETHNRVADWIKKQTNLKPSNIPNAVKEHFGDRPDRTTGTLSDLSSTTSKALGEHGDYRPFARPFDLISRLFHTAPNIGHNMQEAYQGFQNGEGFMGKMKGLVHGTGNMKPGVTDALANTFGKGDAGASGPTLREMVNSNEIPKGVGMRPLTRGLGLGLATGIGSAALNRYAAPITDSVGGGKEFERYLQHLQK